MRKSAWVVLAAGLSLSAGVAVGLSLRSFRNGVYYSAFPEEEKFEARDGTDSGRFSQYRVVAQIPASYGRLVGLYAGGPGAVLWYEDEKGILRNVSVEDSRPIAIERTATVTTTRP